MKIAWTLVAVLAAAAVLAGWIAFRWGVQPQYAGIVSYSGLLLSVFGIIGTAAGFLLAFQQLARTSTASQAASDTLNEIRSKLSSLSASSEVERAKLSLEETERHVMASRWKSIRYSLPAARQSFVRIQAIDLPLFSDLRDQTEACIAQMGELCDLPDEPDKDVTKKIGSYVRQYIDIANTMQIRIARA